MALANLKKRTWRAVGYDKERSFGFSCDGMMQSGTECVFVRWESRVVLDVSWVGGTLIKLKLERSYALQNKDIFGAPAKKNWPGAEFTLRTLTDHRRLLPPPSDMETNFVQKMPSSNASKGQLYHGL